LLSGRIVVPAIPGRSSSISFLRVNAPYNRKGKKPCQHSEATRPEFKSCGSLCKCVHTDFLQINTRFRSQDDIYIFITEVRSRLNGVAAGMPNARQDSEAWPARDLAGMWSIRPSLSGLVKTADGPTCPCQLMANRPLYIHPSLNSSLSWDH